MSEASEGRDFIRRIVAEDVAAGRCPDGVVTRFPPEPNGYLHLGHAKSICLNFGIAEEFGGRCHLRFDDTNPEKENVEYVDSIKEDVRWLGYEWDRECYASDYFEQLYAFAHQLIDQGDAYVCELDGETIRAQRGTLTEPGTNSPYRDRPAAESRALLERMRAGAFPDGSRVLRARIDMAHPNLHLRDPVLYRIRRAHHHRTGDAWPIYPTYDFTHGQSDSLEGITHSLCTLEFEDHRPLYDWFLERLGIFRSRQYEFARLQLEYTVMSKRRLLQLVAEGQVEGWDDPRMPTLSGLRRRGVPPEAIRTFCRKIGVTKYNATTDFALLEHCVREVLNRTSQRRMAVLDPLAVTLTNLGVEETVEVEAVNNPEDPQAGTRTLRLGRHLWIERGDFLEEPPRKFFRLAPGKEVRLRYGFVIRCEAVDKDEAGKVVGLQCSVDRDTLGRPPEGRKVKGVIHWVNRAEAVPVEVRLYDRLFRVPQPGRDHEGNPVPDLNPDSLRVVEALAEPALAAATPGESFQWERIGYFVRDAGTGESGGADGDAEGGRDGGGGEARPRFNRTVTLRDSWGGGG
jgi:glutaminyl-tRNA synthetase